MGGAAPWIVFTDQKPATLATIVGYVPRCLAKNSTIAL